MQLVERHIFKDKNKELFNLCHLSKNLYNYSNYLIRQEFTSTGKMISEYALTTQLAKENQVDYRALPAQTSQQVIKLLFKNWKSFFKSIKEYKKSPYKYLGRPKLPRYKDKRGTNIAIFSNQNARLDEDGFIHFCHTIISPIKTLQTKIDQVRIIPKCNCYIIEVVYTKEEIKHELNKDNYLSIDLGINNLITFIDNSASKAYIINGKIIKRINQWFNKEKARLQSCIGDKETSKRINNLIFRRNNMIEDIMHKTSKKIIDYCIQNKIATIVIGYNEEWKQNSNMSKKTNQSFCLIPHKTLINKISYKAKLNGIEVIMVNESYTSKCDSLSLETLCKHETYKGKRIKRGLFQSSIGKLINADVNGALNILRKVIGDDFISLINVSCVLQPSRLNV